MDRPQLADFLRTRREALQPEDVGLPRGPRRRTSGLRREEVAALCGMSTDYYGRLEQQRGPQPSEPMLGAIARGLRLSLAERDHLFRLAGHGTPTRVRRSDHVDAGLMRVLDRLVDTPALVIGPTGETLAQNDLALALLGDETALSGDRRYVTYRWFTEPAARGTYPAEDHDLRGRQFAADLREAYARDGRGSVAERLVESLLRESEEFARVWAEHEVGHTRTQVKRYEHAAVGPLELYCQSLLDPEQHHVLLVLTPEPGSASAEKLELLRVLGPAAR
ncbi:helix-turn-helix transcriptional regulator [Nocardioides bruguierae]|uniref:helix-turn-helix transcriptional regulator n=1 Tax=Nocardioides bruguierae TaxID=2945102 RepID=UPI002021E895|nr:helix-turn-helix transcriptional regulator [Nocardioides bruguierae]MCL8027730.1 helix-turn-helix transcriptional regulator [Nocardioides bruguierae]